MSANRPRLGPGANLSGVDLRGLNLRGIDLSRANLSNAHLEGAILRGVNLSRANLSNAHLEGATLTNSSLQDAHLEGAHLEGTILTDSDLNSANLSNAHLEGAILINAILSRANLQDAHLNGANLTRASLFGTLLNGADLSDTILLNAVGTPNYVRQEAVVRRAPAAAAPAAAPAAAAAAPAPAAAHQAYNHFDILRAHQGRAYEIHNYFDMLREEEITDFLQKFNVRTELNQKTIQSFAASNSEQSLFTPLLNFIDNSELFRPDEKEQNKQNLNRILTTVTPYRGFNAKRDLLNSTIEFVSKQSDDFIQQYIQILIVECLSAYGRGGPSCVKGMFERIVTTLGEVANTLTKDKNQDNETYKTLKYLFPQINFGELVQEWGATYLEGGEKEEELRSLSIPERKAHFINFMETKYRDVGLLNPTIRIKISEEANEYQEVLGVFERMAFGRRRINKKTRRKGNKKTIKKGNKKTIKKGKNKRKKTIKKR